MPRKPSSPLAKIMEEREAMTAEAVEVFERRLTQLANTIGRRLGAALGVDPDTVAERIGGDGVDLGDTALEDILELDDIDRTRAALLAASIEEIEDFVDACGLYAARDDTREAVRRLAGLAERELTAAGFDASGALDTQAAAAFLGDYLDTMDEDLYGTISKAAAKRIRAGVLSNLGMVSPAELAGRIMEREALTVAQAKTEARTQLMDAGQAVHNFARKTLDPDGTETLLAYMGPRPTGGPKDPIRQFCRALVGRAFEEADLAPLDNRQQPTHPRVSRGGYNCRHHWSAVRRSALERLGLVLGTKADIQKANRGAARDRGTKAA